VPAGKTPSGALRESASLPRQPRIGKDTLLKTGPWGQAQPSELALVLGERAFMPRIKFRFGLPSAGVLPLRWTCASIMRVSVPD